jgi:hypothetical protein
MPSTLIITQPTGWRRRTRQAGRVARDGVLLALHLAVAVIVLAVRIPYTLLGIAARSAAAAELALTARTGRRPLGQTFGVVIAAAFTHEFATAARANYYHPPTR